MFGDVRMMKVLYLRERTWGFYRWMGYRNSDERTTTLRWRSKLEPFGPGAEKVAKVKDN
jgi:hypothetical protein